MKPNQTNLVHVNEAGGTRRPLSYINSEDHTQDMDPESRIVEEKKRRV